MAVLATPPNLRGRFAFQGGEHGPESQADSQSQPRVLLAYGRPMDLTPGPNYWELPEDKLEELAHERGFKHGWDFFIERKGDGWFASWKTFDDPADIAPEGVIMASSESATKQAAIVHLLQSDDIAGSLG